VSELSQSINENQIIEVWEMYEVEEKYRAHIVDWKPWYQSIRDYECVFNIRGKAAHYYIVTSDRSITRAEAISFAKALYEGKISRVHVDLSGIGTRRGK